MKIIDKHTDYYDYACSYIDRSIVWDRRNKEYLTSDTKSKLLKYNNNSVSAASNPLYDAILTLYEHLNVSTVIVGNNVLFYKRHREFKVVDGVFVYRFMTLDEILEFLDNHKRIYYDNTLTHCLTREYDIEYIREIQYMFNTPVVRFNTESFVSFNKISIELNSILHKISVIPTMLDASTAYQSIEAALIDINNPENNLIEVSNETKVANHGFNHKYAFKKTP